MYPTFSNMKKRVFTHIKINRQRVGIAYFNGQFYQVTEECYKAIDPMVAENLGLAEKYAEAFVDGQSAN